MAKKNNSDLFYTCSLIEFIGRKTKQTRKDIADFLGRDTINHIYKYAGVFHCEMIEKVAAEFIESSKIPQGSFDNEKKCKYRVPDYWTIGEVYERLIEDCFSDEEITEGIWIIYHSWIDNAISDYNTDFYYQSRDYIAACYRAGEILN